MPEKNMSENQNRFGFIRSGAKGRAFEYANGTPFFMLGDTWWAASTRWFPMKGVKPSDNYIPTAGISFEEALHYRKKKRFNNIAKTIYILDLHMDLFAATSYLYNLTNIEGYESQGTRRKY